MLVVGLILAEQLSTVSDIYTHHQSSTGRRRRLCKDHMQSANHKVLRTTLEAISEPAFGVLQIYVKAPLRVWCYYHISSQKAEVTKVHYNTVDYSTIKLEANVDLEPSKDQLSSFVPQGT